MVLRRHEFKEDWTVGASRVFLNSALLISGLLGDVAELS